MAAGKRKVAIFGSTGSIGKNALEVIRNNPDEFEVAGLSALHNGQLLSDQAREFKCRCIGIGDAHASVDMLRLLPEKTKVFKGKDGLINLLDASNCDIVVLAISGSAALGVLQAALRLGKQVALANKEALVMAGPLIMSLARQHKGLIVPVDSEQSAIWQCLIGQDRKEVKKIILTASGGPLRLRKADEFSNLTVEEVIHHPRWKMGKKISVDSASLFNKGLEYLETMFLFDLPAHQVEVLVHPEALIHSMVEFVDGVILAQLSVTDMRIPIQYALTYPKRLATSLPGIDFATVGKLHFEKPDLKKFPCLSLAFTAAAELGTLPAVMNAANEVGVDSFLERKIKFSDIAVLIEKVMHKHKNNKTISFEAVYEADSWAKGYAQQLVEGLHR